MDVIRDTRTDSIQQYGGSGCGCGCGCGCGTEPIEQPSTSCK